MNSYERKWRHETFFGDTIGKEDNLSKKSSTSQWTSACVLELYSKRIVEGKNPLYLV